MTITQKELAKKIASALVRPRLYDEEVYQILETFKQVLTAELQAGNEIKLTGFGKFKTAIRKGRRGYDPIIKQHIEVPSVRIAKFITGTRLKKEIK